MQAQDAASFVAFASALAGAFLGAISAFALEALRRWRSDRGERHTALLRAQFALTTQLNTLISITNQYLAEEADNPTRFAILPIYNVPSEDPRVELESLVFTASGGDHTLLMRIQAAEATYDTALHALDARNRVYREQVLTFEGAPVPVDIETGQSRVELDTRKVAMLKGITDELYQLVESGIKAERRAIDRVVEVSHQKFPRKPTLPTTAPFVQRIEPAPETSSSSD